MEKQFSYEQDTDNFLLECVLQVTIQAQHCILMNFPAMDVPDAMKLQPQTNFCYLRNLLSLDYLALVSNLCRRHISMKYGRKLSHLLYGNLNLLLC